RTTRPIPPAVDLNGAAVGSDAAATFVEDRGPISVVNSLKVTVTSTGNLSSAYIVLTNRPDGSAERLSVDTSGTSISASSYNPLTGVLTLTGPATAAEFKQVFGTLKYENTKTIIDTTERLITISVNDGQLNSRPASVRVDVVRQFAAPVLDLSGASAVTDFTTNADPNAKPIPIVATDFALSHPKVPYLVSAQVFRPNFFGVTYPAEFYLTADTSGTPIVAHFYWHTLSLTGTDPAPVSRTPG
ncbi:MAG: hypothetical protein ACRD2M_11105, partial [Terriglobales bacterium]